MKKCCCKGCENRVVGCHSNCEEYRKYKNVVDAEKEEERKQKEIDGILNCYNKEKKKSLNKNFRKRG